MCAECRKGHPEKRVETMSSKPASCHENLNFTTINITGGLKFVFIIE